ncbi:MAG: hypothetical protein JNM90_04870 [Burkholderiales bacterium]|nr:hypothetical protein [Burkholderiales bacterium]
MSRAAPSAPGAWQVIHLEREAPRMPAQGAPCNGCGVCCAVAPCPLGMLISRRRRGACAALVWDDGGRRYLCGAASRPEAILPARLGALAPLFARLARRWIAAGSGCDAALDAVPAARPGGRG